MRSRPSVALLLAAFVLLAAWSQRASAQNFGFRLEYTTGAAPRALAFADVNVDGKLDFVSANTNANTVSVLLGNGIGALGAKTDVAFTAPISVALGDVNGDGKPDLAACGGGTVSTFLGNGLGAFGARTDYALPGTAKSLALGDVTGDGRIDLVVAMATPDVVALYPGNGFGGFGARQDYALSGGPEELTLGDLNVDGRLDACVLTPSPSPTVSVLLSNAAGGFSPRTDYATGTDAQGLALGDVSGDGRLDVVTANSFANNTSVLLGDGAGAFLPKTDYFTGVSAYRVAIAEVTGDGMPDLCLATSGTFLVVQRGTGGGAFTSGGSFSLSPQQTGLFAIAAGDLNGDGRADLAIGAQSTSLVSVLMNRTQSEFRTRDDLTANASVVDVAVGDLNKDGRPDLVSYSNSLSSVSVFLANPAGGFLAKTDYPTISGAPLSIAVGEVTGDTNPDVVVTRLTGNVLAVMNGNGSGSVTFGTTYPVGTNPVDVALTDMNNDARLDAIVVNNSAATVSVLLGSGGGFAAKTDYATGTGPQRVATGDFNGDGLQDVVVTNATANTVSVLLGTGAGALGAKTDFTVGTTPVGVAVGDLNGDGFLDIVTANGGNASVLLGAGTGSFGPKTDYPALAPLYEIALGDVNGDGRKDVCATRSVATSNVYLLAGNGGGGFGAASTITVQSNPLGLALTELNADGRLDLITANSGASSVSVLVGLESTQTTLTATPAAPLLLGWPMTLTATVTVPPPGSGAPADSVRFFDGFALLGTAPVSGGVASLNLFAPYAGDRALRAYYKGDTRLISSGSAVAMRRVVPTPAAAITGVSDVAGDQGGAVRLAFARSPYDYAGSGTPITGYHVYRRTIIASAAQSRDALARDAAGAPPPSEVQIAGWDFVVTVPATAEAAYETVVPTLADSNDVGFHRAVLFVRAATASPSVFYDSAADSGYSVDNLPPLPPSPFVAAYESGATHLHWGANTEADLWHYRVYRGASAAFVPAPGNRIASLADTGYADVGAPGSYYKLSAVDVNGNESAFALLTPEAVVGVSDGGAPAFAFESVLPNPGRAGAMRLTFALPRAAPATLEWFDVRGRRVATREVGSLGAGRHSVPLGDVRLAPGSYVVRLKQGEASATRRVTVVEG